MAENRTWRRRLAHGLFLLGSAGLLAGFVGGVLWLYLHDARDDANLLIGIVGAVGTLVGGGLVALYKHWFLTRPPMPAPVPAPAPPLYPPAPAYPPRPQPYPQRSPFRLFLAAPDDVGQERQIVRDVLAVLRAEPHIQANLDLAEPVTWDHPASGPALSDPGQPWQSITRGLPGPADCELFIGVFWGRIGTPDPVPERKPDGSPYRSGTEYEYALARAAQGAQGRPAVWLFRRRPGPALALDDPHRAEVEAQWAALEDFFAPFGGADGSDRDVYPYRDPADFRTQLTDLLREHLHQFIAGLAVAAPVPPAVPALAHPPAPPPDPARAAHLTSLAADLDLALDLPAHYSGEPFPGLHAFTDQQRPVFFGREPEIDGLLHLCADPARRCIAVVGASGTGKSSLVAAGLLPRLRAGVIHGEPWRDLTLTPAAGGSPDPFRVLAGRWQGAARAAGLPAEPCPPAELAADLRRDPEQLTARLARLADGGEVVLVIDQAEELFTQTDPTLVAPFIDLLAAVADAPGQRVLLTLRVDFYPAAVAHPPLARLLQGGGTFPLHPPGPAALGRMIEGPSGVVGLTLEPGLVTTLQDAAGGGPGALPLVAFMLRELWQAAGADGRLTLAGYRALGGLAGAVQRRATETLGRLPLAHQAALPDLFAALVEVNEQEVATRRRARRDDLTPALRALAAALTGARLLTAGDGAGGAATVELAHEALLDAWPDLKRWVPPAAEPLRARRDLERAAAEWVAAGRPRAALKGGALLKRYRRAPPPRSATAARFIKACRRQVAVQRVALGLALAGALVLWQELNTPERYSPWLRVQGWAANQGWRQVPEPAMIDLAPGRFEMGDVAGDDFYPDEQPVHEVSILEPFALGQFEVTFAEYDLFAAATGAPRPLPQVNGALRKRLPVVSITWDEATAYAAWLSQRTGRCYRLPSEAEWEYAARAGTRAARWWEETDGPDALACEYANAQDQTRAAALSAQDRTQLVESGFWEPLPCADGEVNEAAVGSYRPNPWGLHDMLGNVWEWVADCYTDDYADAPLDGLPVTAESDVSSKKCAYRVLRGGSWNDGARDLRAPVRNGDSPNFRFGLLGLRLARSD